MTGKQHAHNNGLSAIRADEQIFDDSNSNQRRNLGLGFLNSRLYHCTGRRADGSRNPVLRQAGTRCAL
jgi:hypothetical protein